MEEGAIISKFKKIGATGILIAIPILPLISYAAQTMLEHRERIVRIETNEKNMTDAIFELKRELKSDLGIIQADIKSILKSVK